MGRRRSLRTKAPLVSIHFSSQKSARFTMKLTLTAIASVATVSALFITGQTFAGASLALQVENGNTMAGRSLVDSSREPVHSTIRALKKKHHGQHKHSQRGAGKGKGKHKHSHRGRGAHKGKNKHKHSLRGEAEVELQSTPSSGNNIVELEEVPTLAALRPLDSQPLLRTHQTKVKEAGEPWVIALLSTGQEPPPMPTTEEHHVYTSAATVTEPKPSSA